MQHGMNDVNVSKSFRIKCITLYHTISHYISIILYHFLSLYDPAITWRRGVKHGSSESPGNCSSNSCCPAWKLASDPLICRKKSEKAGAAGPWQASFSLGFSRLLFWSFLSCSGLEMARSIQVYFWPNVFGSDHVLSVCRVFSVLSPCTYHLPSLPVLPFLPLVSQILVTSGSLLPPALLLWSTLAW